MATSEAMECFARDMDLNFAAWVKLNQHVICLVQSWVPLQTVYMSLVNLIACNIFLLCCILSTYIISVLLVWPYPLLGQLLIMNL